MVTALGLVRWLEVVEGIDLAEIRREMGFAANPGEILDHLWKTREINARDLTEEILTPIVRSAILAGVRKVSGRNAYLIIEDGKVVTVISKDKRLQDLSNVDRKRRCQIKNRLGRRAHVDDAR
jgi:hypothetical protein